jgi:hypothetical protein
MVSLLKFLMKLVIYHKMPKKEPKIRGKSKDVKSNISKPKADKAKLKSKSESTEKKCIFQCILKKNCKLVIAISVIFLIFAILFIYKSIQLKYVANSLNDLEFVNIEDYNYQFTLAPSIKINNLKINNLSNQYHIDLNNIIVASNLFSNEFNLKFEDDIKIINEGNIASSKLHPDSKISLKMTHNKIAIIKFQSPNIQTIDSDNNILGEIKDLDFMYNSTIIDDKNKTDVAFSSSNIMTIFPGAVTEYAIGLKYNSIYEIDENGQEGEYPLSAIIEDLKIYNDKAGFYANGEYKMKDFNFDIELKNKEYIFNSLSQLMTGNLDQIQNEKIGPNFDSLFQNKDEFITQIEFYKKGILNFLTDIAAKNSETSMNKDVFKIISDQVQLLYVNDVSGSEIFGMFPKYFANDPNQK